MGSFFVEDCDVRAVLYSFLFLTGSVESPKTFKLTKLNLPGLSFTCLGALTRGWTSNIILQAMEEFEIWSWYYKYMFEKKTYCSEKKKHPDGNWPERGETWLRFIGNFSLKFLPTDKVEIVPRNFYLLAKFKPDKLIQIPRNIYNWICWQDLKETTIWMLSRKMHQFDSLQLRQIILGLQLETRQIW